LRRLAAVNHANACDLADRLAKVKGVEVVTPTFFNEFAIRLPRDGISVVDALADKGVLGGVPYARLAPEQKDLANLVIVTSTEVNTAEDRAACATALSEVLA
jgi:glycine dehydrogenase subunit 1